MIGHRFAHCDRTLLLLLKTLLDILLLREGPDRLPRSWPVFFVTLVASLLMSMSSDAIVFPDMVPMYDVTLLLTVINVGFYFVVLKVTGYVGRSLQSFSAILGVDALLTVIYLGGFLFMGLLADRTTALYTAWILSCWSVPVEGHIISRAIGRHWSVGIVIAIVAYSLLFLTYLQFVDQP